VIKFSAELVQRKDGGSYAKTSGKNSVTTRLFTALFEDIFFTDE
jgi:hypothetical protein